MPNKYLSGRVERTSQSDLTDDRYEYLGLEQAEPNLGDPSVIPQTLPVGQQYQVISVLGSPGNRFWIPVGGGLIPGAITVFDEGVIVPTNAGVSSITQVNFVGAAISAKGYVYADGSPGIGVTITVFAPGNNQQLLFNNNNEFGTSSLLTFDNVTGILTAGKALNVGIGGTVITATSLGLVGIGTTNPTQELDVNGDIRIRGTIYDYNNQPGVNQQVLLKNNFGGLSWNNQSSIRAGAGGTYTQVQYHNASGLVDGATGFVYDPNTNKVGIGSTSPRYILDVIGTVNISGLATITNLYVSGIGTFNDIVYVISTEQSTSTSTGALVVSGGVGIAKNLNVGGVAGISSLNVTNHTTSGSLYVSGISTLGVTSITNLTAQTLNVSGISTLGVTSITNLTAQTLRVSGISTLGVTSTTNLTSQTLNVSGISTLGVTSATNLTSQQLNVSGISTLGVTSATNLTSQQLNVSGISTLGVTSTTNLTSQTLRVSGISTLGVTTATDLTAQSLVVGGISTFYGNILPGSNGFYDIGNVLYKFNEVYADTFVGQIIGNADTATVATNVNGGTGNLTALNVSGISTLGVTTTTDLTAQSLVISGIGTITNLNSTNGTITTFNSTNGTITNLTGTGVTYTNGTITNLTGIAGTITTLNSTNGTITNLTGTAGTITTFNSTTGTITNLTGTAGTITTFNSTTGTITNLTGTGVTYTNGTITNLTGTGVTYTNGTITNLNSTNGNITNLTGTAGTITTLNSTTGTITNLTGTGVTYTNGTFTNLSAGSISYTNSNATNLYATNGYINVGIVTTISGTNLNYTNGTITNLTGTAGTITNLTGTGVTYTNGTFTNLTGTNLNITGISTFQGNVTLGDANTDKVSFGATVDSNIIPSGSRDLGSVANPWSNVYATTITGTIAGNADTATKLLNARTIAITGDLAYTSPAFDGTGNVTAAGTLATVNSNVGTFGSSTFVPQITVNAKGLVTGASSVGVNFSAATVAQADKLTNARTIAITGDLAYTSPAFDGTGNVTAAGTLATVNSNVGTFGSSTFVPQITVNAKGLVTGVSSVGVNFSAATVAQADKLTNARTIAITGDLAYTSPAFDGTGNVTAAGTLANTAVTAGSYGSGSQVATFTVDAKGRLTAASNTSITGINASSVAAAGGDTQVQFNDGGTFAGDADFTFAKTTNTVTTRFLALNGNGSTTSAQLAFNGGTNNWITFGTTGVAAPAFTTRSVGTKIVLYDGIGASSADYGFGIDNGTLWSSVPTTSQQFKWYGGTTLAATLSGAGAFTLTGNAPTATEGQIFINPTTAGQSRISFYNNGGVAGWNAGQKGTGGNPNDNHDFVVSKSVGGAEQDFIRASAQYGAVRFQAPTLSATVGNIYVSPSSAGQARYHLYNGGATAEWIFGQKTNTNHNFIISKLVSGTETDYLTINTSGNIGIGTINPGASLHITPTASSIAGLFSGTTSSDMVRITQLGTGNALVVEDSTNPDSSPFVVKSDGSVGINQTNPQYNLDVYGYVNINEIGSLRVANIISPNGNVYFENSSIEVDGGILTGSIELGHATDTTLSRVSAGVVSIEGVNIVTTSSTDTLTNKTLTSPTLTTPILGTPASGNLANCTFPTLNQNTTGNAATATNVDYSGLTGTVPTWNQNTTGNAATATVLQTARTINGVSFDGSANIVTNPSSTAGGAYSNGYGGKWIANYTPTTEGSDGDIWYQIT